MTPGKINSKKMKAINSQLVLNAIRKENQISRKDLVTKTGLTSGTVTNIVGALIRKKYLIEVGSGDSEGGRKPILLEMNADLGYVVGLELEVTHITCVISDFKAAVLSSERMKIDIADGKEKIIDQMVALVKSVVKSVDARKEEILGLGLAIPGPCNFEKGIMINPPNFPGWENVPIKDILKKRLGLKIYTSKETSCALLAEYWFGEANGAQRVFGLMVQEVGIGGAMLIDGEIFQEREGDSMNIGHSTVQTDGSLCACGNHGCLEIEANPQAARRYVKEFIASGQKSVVKDATYQNIVDGALQGDEVCLEAIKKCAFYISVALRNMLTLLVPQQIYLGGDFIEDCPILYDKIIEYLERHEYPAGCKNAVKSRYTFKHENAAIGGLALVFNALSKV